MEDESPVPAPTAVPAQLPPAAPAVAHPSRQVLVYPISAEELDQLENRGGSLVWTFFGIAFGAFLTSLAALISGDSFGATGLVILIAIVTSGSFLSLLCFGIAVRDGRRVRRLAKSLRAPRQTDSPSH